MYTEFNGENQVFVVIIKYTNIIIVINLYLINCNTNNHN